MAPAGEIEPPATTQEQRVRVCERPVRLSESAIWRLERDYFQSRGVRAWSSGEVPYTGTNTPALAPCYVEVFEGLVADAAAGHFGAFDPGQPFYVIELGAGAGGCAYHFLRALDLDVLPSPPVYVMSDLAGSNLDFWREHPNLAPFVRSGLLDFARFDAAGDDTLRLEHRGDELRAGQVANPLLVVANYFFDVLPQDLFVAAGGELLEERVAMALPDGVEVTDGDVFDELHMVTERHPAPGDYYGEPVLDAALAAMAFVRRRRPPGRFLFPVVALRMIENLRRLSDQRLVVLAHERPGSIQDFITTNVIAAGYDPDDPADVEMLLRQQSVAVEAEVDGVEGDGGGEPRSALPAFALIGLAAHGPSFSLPVERDAFVSAALDWGGELIVPKDRPTRTAISALVTGAPDGCPHTRRRFGLAFDEGSPEQLFHALLGAGAAEPAASPSEVSADGTALEDGRDAPSALPRLLALLRICAYDTQVFGELFPQLRTEVEGAPDPIVDDLVDALRTVCDRHYPIGGKSDPALAAAALLAPVGRYTEALEFMAQSVEVHGPQAQVSYNVALCHLRLGDLPAARAAADEALAFEEPVAGAQQLRAAILEEMDAANRP